jgi:23S rRNA (cytosine1962-C5)-methyltransferase
LARGHENYRLNRLDSDKTEFVRADALGFMKRALRRENRFGCIILDPPSFSRHEGKTFSVKNDLGPLVGVAMNILKPGGVLLVSTNYSGLSQQALEEAVRNAGKKEVKSIKRLGQDADFCGSGRMPESYLAAVLVKT